MIYCLAIFFITIIFLNDHGSVTNAGVNIPLIIEALDIYINAVYNGDTLNIIDSVNFVSQYSTEAIQKIKTLINIAEKIPEHYIENFADYLASIKTHEDLTALQELTNEVPSNNAIKAQFAKNKIKVLNEIRAINEMQTDPIPNVTQTTNKIPYISTITSVVIVTGFIILSFLTN